MYPASKHNVLTESVNMWTKAVFDVATCFTRARPTAAECLQNPWIQGDRPPSKHTDSVVCFSTDKLQAYLREREVKRDHIRTKINLPFP